MTPADIARAYKAGRPVADIAAAAGVDESTIWRTLQRQDVELRGRPDIVHAQQRLTERWLRAQWVDEQRSMGQIARDACVDPSTVREALARHGLLDLRGESRDQRVHRLTDAERARLHDLYVVRELTIPEVARELGVAPRTARRYLLAGGVELRAPGRRPGSTRGL